MTAAKPPPIHARQSMFWLLVVLFGLLLSIGAAALLAGNHP